MFTASAHAVHIDSKPVKADVRGTTAHRPTSDQPDIAPTTNRKCTFWLQRRLKGAHVLGYTSTGGQRDKEHSCPRAHMSLCFLAASPEKKRFQYHAQDAYGPMSTGDRQSPTPKNTRGRARGVL
ncbi:unnamed protein product [Peniophora sp. CBMAI 1063]|nr:unnamed protein product [Peniophora sp. CBMAI 1063]